MFDRTIFVCILTRFSGMQSFSDAQQERDHQFMNDQASGNWEPILGQQTQKFEK